MTRIQLNAFDKDSPASYSKTIQVKDVTQLNVESEKFDNEVPFSRFYRESEILDGENDEIEKALAKLDN